MPARPDILLYGGSPWHGNRSSVSRETGRALLAAGCRILYVEGEPSPPAAPEPGLTLARMPRLPGVPLTWPPLSLRLHLALQRRDLADRVRKAGFADWVFLHHGWYSAALAGRLGQRLDVVDCIDPHEAMPRVARVPRRASFVVEEERRLLRAADGLVVTSPALLPGRADLVPAHVVLENGVDPEAFPPFPGDPEDLAPVPRPRLAVAGNLTSRYDLSVLGAVLDADPGRHAILLGPVEDGIPVPDSPRVHRFGALPHAALARRLVRADVGLVPMADHPANRASCPLKALEYLAAGLPVVTSRNAVIDRWAERHPGLMFPVDARADWPAAVARALAAGAEPGFADRARGAAREHTWARRAEDLLAFLDRLAPRSRD